MKKFIAILLVLVMVLSMTACGSSSETTTIVDDDGNEVEVVKYTMIVGHSQGEGNPRTISMESFAEDVYEQTNGQVEVIIYDSGSLGSEKETLEQVVAGQIQGMRGGQFDFSPRLLMFTLPFLANTADEVAALLSSDLAMSVAMEAEEETGTVIINMCDAGGFRQFSTTGVQLTDPSDFAGLKMRSNGMLTVDWTLEALGASPVTVAYNELYMGLSTGLADGQENPWTNIASMKFYEVQDNFTQVNYQFHPDPFYVNADWWNALPADLQDIVMDCATDMGNYNNDLIIELESEARQTVIDAGGNIYYPTDAELAVFQEAVSSVYDTAIAEGICTQAEIDEMLEIVANA
ncbi:MAG: TRAP transporter substrate-binding protein [Bacillota bacterium]